MAQKVAKAGVKRQDGYLYFIDKQGDVRLEHYADMTSDIPSNDTILALLEHEEPEVQQFGAKLLESSSSLATLPVSSWLKLLETKNEEALQRICDAFARHVTGEILNVNGGSVLVG